MTDQGFPKYRGDRTRCDSCEIFFRKGDMIAISVIEERELVFCGQARSMEPECLKALCRQKEILDRSFEIMEYQGKQNGSTGDSAAPAFDW